MPIDECEITADTKIIGTALRYKLEAGVDNIMILTNDRKMKNISIACGIRAEHYPFQLHATVNDSAAVKESLSGAQKKVA